MLESDIVESILTMLEIDAHPEVRLSAFDAIVELAKHGKFSACHGRLSSTEADDSQCKMMEYDIISPVLAALGDTNPSIRHSSLCAVTELVHHGKFPVRQ